MAQQAFPSADERAPDGTGIREGSSGMSLRDWFAGQALAGLLPEYLDRNGFHDTMALNASVHAYRIADAMIAAREQGK